MEQQNQTQESGLFGLTIDAASKMHLFEAAKWGKFLAIVGFVMCGLIVVGGLVMATMVGSMSRAYGNDMPPGFGATFGPTFMIVYIIIAVLYFFPCLFLLRFSNKMKVALAADNQTELTSSFQNLKVLFRYVGIMIIVAISFYIIALLFISLGMALGR